MVICVPVQILHCTLIPYIAALFSKRSLADPVSPLTAAPHLVQTSNSPMIQSVAQLDMLRFALLAAD